MADFTSIIAWIITVLIATWILYWLWNSVLVKAVTIVNPITFWEALGVAVLARLLFGPNIINENVLVAAMPQEVTRYYAGSPKRRRGSR